jgi:hypothetical protein
VPLNPNHLLVEDTDTCGAVIGLMRHHITWPRYEEDGWPAKIEIMGSSDEVLSKKSLSVKIKESGLEALGLIVDANSDFNARWEAVKDVCAHLGGTAPNTCPSTGLILQAGSKRLGVWIIPDNKSRGMLENFCHTLVPKAAQPLWDFARKCVNDARSQGAPFIDVHVDKAHIHTWLAWQGPPGERMGNAITKTILEHGTGTAMGFVNWFKELYKV